MKTLARIGIVALLLCLVAMSQCSQPPTTAPGVPEGPALWSGIGINGHFDKLGVWVPSWAFVTATDDTVCCFLTKAEADDAGASALLAKRLKDNKQD